VSFYSKIRKFIHPESERDTGRHGEASAANHLRQHGFQIIERNWRCAIGEIDIIAQKADTVVFVEVKASAIKHAIEPQDRVNPRKQKKLMQLAQYYRKSTGNDLPCRFDVIAVWWEHGRQQIEHIEGAF
jgi:putative endonuclease